MKTTEFIHLISKAVSEGTDKAILKHYHRTSAYTKAGAYRLYGRSSVDRWIAEGLLTVSSNLIERTLLDKVAFASNRRTYLPVADR